MKHIPQSYRSYLAEFSQFARGYGLPASTAKVLGWLLICDPARQTARSIQDALELSSGSISGSLALLVRVGMVDRVKLPGARVRHYEVSPDNFKRAILGRLQSASQSRQLAQKGLAMSPHNTRLIAMRDVFVLIEEELPDIIRKLG